MRLQDINETIQAIRQSSQTLNNQQEKERAERNLKKKKGKRNFKDELEKAKAKTLEKTTKKFVPRKENPSIMKALLQSKGAK